MAVAFNGINQPVLVLFHDSGVFRHAIIIPVEENNHARFRLNLSVIPFPLFDEPPNPLIADSVFGQAVCFQHARLVGTPADENRAPIDVAVKSVPAPVDLAAPANFAAGLCLMW